jgi:glycosyltransferase involved in cell wall biosynthesis
MSVAEGSRDAGKPEATSVSGPLVSVVIAFLDPPERFLREAVASVGAQDYRPLELILVNDGSQRRVVELAKSLAASVRAPVRFVEHPGGANRGSSASRNLGAAAAAGEYLAFLDADDAWVPSKISEQVQFLQHDPALALVFGPSRYWYSWAGTGDGIPEDFTPDRGVEQIRRFSPPAYVPLFLRGKIINPCPTNFMVRRDAFFACGGFEEVFRGMYEDQAFLVKLGLGHSVAAVPRCWDRYRQHAASMTAQANAAGAEEEARRDFLVWVRSHCSRSGVGAPEVWEAVHKELWLLGPRPARLRGPRSRLTRWVKSRWLRFEEALLPAGLRQRSWGRASR